MPKFHWGILGTGHIAHSFANGLKDTPGAQLIAVGSRSLESAQKFGAEFKIAHCHDSYQALAQDPSVDAIYISTLNPLHMENTLLCLDNRKPVLCEKPFALNAAQARRMIAAARKKKVFLMEAMWTRFNPVSRRVMQLVRSGAIGEVRMLHCNFGIRRDWNPHSRLLDLKQGGGGLLDVGVYCVSYASMVLGKAPKEITGLATLGKTKVDEQAAFTFKYDKGELALLSCAVRTRSPHEATIMGTEGIIRVPNFWKADGYILNEKAYVVKTRGNKYNYEALEVQQCVRAGKLESKDMPLDETLEIMQTMDTLRKQWNMQYPEEK